MWDIDAQQRVWEFVSLKHAGQTYGGRVEGQQIPYITHLSSVAHEVLWGWDHDAGLDLNLALQCALLHDVIEDTGTSFDEVKHHFGGRVAEGVLALTKNATIQGRHAQMEDSLRRIKQQSLEIWCVKLGDRICNLQHPPFYWDEARIETYKEEARFILSELGAANQKLAKRLSRKIAEYGKGA